MNTGLRSPYFFALDVDDIDRAKELAHKTCQFVGGFKIGPRLALRGGPNFIKQMAEQGPIFLDFKFFDIPSTMVSAVEACFDCGVSFVTVHAACGPIALRALADLEQKLNRVRPFRILAVTVLTSFAQETLPSFLQDIAISDQVHALASLAWQSGLTGFVCSPHELATLRQQWAHSFLVSPGIRLKTDKKDDQVCTLEPEQAFAQGASALVIGRPILSAAQPEKKAQDIFKLFESFG